MRFFDYLNVGYEQIIDDTQPENISKKLNYKMLKN